MLISPKQTSNQWSIGKGWFCLQLLLYDTIFQNMYEVKYVGEFQAVSKREVIHIVKFTSFPVDRSAS